MSIFQNEESKGAATKAVDGGKKMAKAIVSQVSQLLKTGDKRALNPARELSGS